MLKALKFGTPIRLKRLAIAYPAPENGTLYYDNPIHKIAVYANNAWDYIPLGSDVDRLLSSLGTSVASNGGWLGFSGTAFLDATLTLTGALEELDSQIAALDLSKSLQQAYMDGNEISTSDTYGNVVISGTESLALEGAANLILQGTGNLDLTTNYITGQNVRLIPQVLGSVIAESSSTPVTMNTRGENVLDLQLVKTLDDSVASGDMSAILGGEDNSVQALAGVALGGKFNSVPLFADNSVALGQSAYAVGPNSLVVGNGSLRERMTDSSRNYVTVDGQNANVRIGRAIDHDALRVSETISQTDSSVGVFAQDVATKMVGQSITPSESGVITSLNVWMQQIGVPDADLLIEFWELVGDTPTTVVESKTVNLSLITWDDYNQFYFDTPIGVVSGIEYLITFSYQNVITVDVSNYIDWYGANPSAYTNGDLFSYTTSWIRHDLQGLRFEVDIGAQYFPQNRLYLHATQNLHQSNSVYLSGEDTSDVIGSILGLHAEGSDSIKVRRYDGDYYTEEEYLDSISLPSTITPTAIIKLRLDTSKWKSMMVVYTLINTVTGERQIGRLLIVVNDALTASFSDDYTHTNSIGLSWNSAFIGGSNELDILYSCPEDCLLHCDVKRMRA